MAVVLAVVWFPPGAGTVVVALPAGGAPPAISVWFPAGAGVVVVWLPPAMPVVVWLPVVLPAISCVPPPESSSQYYVCI